MSICLNSTEPIVLDTVCEHKAPKAGFPTATYAEQDLLQAGDHDLLSLPHVSAGEPFLFEPQINTRAYGGKLCSTNPSTKNDDVKI